MRVTRGVPGNWLPDRTDRKGLPAVIGSVFARRRQQPTHIPLAQKSSLSRSEGGTRQSNAVDLPFPCTNWLASVVHDLRGFDQHYEKPLKTRRRRPAGQLVGHRRE